MKPRLLILTSLALCVMVACKRDAQPVAKPGDYVVKTWALPAEAGAMAPDLSLAPGDRLLLSWVSHRVGRRNALQYAAYTETAGWQSQPRTIAVGSKLLANAVDVPHVRASADGALWAQWLQARTDGPKGYNLILARSRDGGMRWDGMTEVNTDDLPAEHGFAALYPRTENSMDIAWLDGRELTAQGGTAQVRSNNFDMGLRRQADTVVETRACECCQTDVAITDKGPLLAYRGRSAEEIRDIQVTRFEAGKWVAPKPVHADGWRIEGCPVAGPAVAATGNVAVVGWYTDAGRASKVQLARSTDAGDGFSAPVVVDQGKPVMGRIDVALDGQQAWVAWLRETQEGQTLLLARYAPDLSKKLQQFEVATLKARGMASGYPKLVANGKGKAWLVWTDVEAGVAQLKGAEISQ